MKRGTKHRSASDAWVYSLPLALGCPTLYWLGLATLHWDWLPLITAVCALLVHFFSYLATGLPIFLACFRNAFSPIWTPRVLVPVGILLGMIALLAVLTLLNGVGTPLIDPGFYLTGGAYGFVTSIAALRQRPILETP